HSAACRHDGTVPKGRPFIIPYITQRMSLWGYWKYQNLKSFILYKGKTKKQLTRHLGGLLFRFLMGKTNRVGFLRTHVVRFFEQIDFTKPYIMILNEISYKPASHLKKSGRFVCFFIQNLHYEHLFNGFVRIFIQV